MTNGKREIVLSAPTEVHHEKQVFFFFFFFLQVVKLLQRPNVAFCCREAKGSVGGVCVGGGGRWGGRG